MIKLFITDLDGCIAPPFVSPNWSAITEIRALNMASVNDPTIPPMSICTGRPMPYAEAVAQWLGIQLPFIFESGGGMYDVVKNTITWHPSFDVQTKIEVEELKHWLEEVIIKNYEGTIPEWAKHTDAAIINQDPTKIPFMLEEIEAYVQGKYMNFEVHHTDVSISILPKSCNKGAGISFLCKTLGVSLEEAAFIGDTGGDVPGLELVGRPFAPANAHQKNKEVAVGLPQETTEAVLEAYKRIIAENRGKA
ncbi:MAG: HAD family hydrolase [Bacteroidota bacterium]